MWLHGGVQGDDDDGEEEEEDDETLLNLEQV